MSQYFMVDGRTLWNPSTAVAALFLRTAEALAPEAATPTGLGPMEADECEIDVPAFTTFVAALVQRYDRSNHPILHSLMEGFIATSLVLVERGGATIPATPSDAYRDIQVTTRGTLPLTPKDWTALKVHHAAAMPT